MDMRFPVKVDGVWREAEAHFATARDVRGLACWRIPKPLPGDERIAQRAYDAVEFARLAATRWSYYHQTGDSVTSMEELVRGIKRRPKAELAMILVARPAWKSQTPILGIAYLRRTWCHHLFLEFFATHPHVITKRREQIGLVGVGLLRQLVALAEALKIECIWGEATEFSHEWYEEQLAVERVLDHFFIEDEVMKHCRDELHKSREQMLARRHQA
jgi:hypothetical protein